MMHADRYLTTGVSTDLFTYIIAIISQAQPCVPVVSIDVHHSILFSVLLSLDRVLRVTWLTGKGLYSVSVFCSSVCGHLLQRKSSF